jgi:TonB family protein
MNETWKQWEGQVVDGKFHLRRYLGGTDDSAVFLTERGEGEEQKAAIKIVSADPACAEKQLALWRAATSLAHPHLMRIFEMGRCRLGDVALLYVVTELADEDLSQILPSRALTSTETSEMLGPVLDSLAYLHGKGMVHGHIKPANIFAVGEQLRISSDGILAAGEMKIGRAKGSVYDAPESATRGSSAAGDVWSLSVTLVEVLTQKVPEWEWKGQEEAALPTMPGQFLDVARHSLRRDPQERWSVAQIAARLQTGAGLPEQIAPTAVAQAQPQSGRQRPSELPASPMQPRTEARRRKTGSNWKFLAWAAAIILVAGAVIFAAPKLYKHGPATPAESSVTVEAAKADESAGRKTDAAATSLQTENSGAEGSSASDTPVPTAPLVTPATPASATQIDIPAKGSSDESASGEVVHRVLPEVPAKARETIQGAVRLSVRVHVDPSGDVSAAEMESAGPSKYFANLAMNAARGWKFAPVAGDGRSRANDWLLRFEFTRDGTKVNADRVGP